MDFIEKFMASMCVRIDRLMMRFKETHDKEPDFPGKEALGSLRDGRTSEVRKGVSSGRRLEAD